VSDLLFWVLLLVVFVVVMNRRARRPREEKEKLALAYRRVPGADLDLSRLPRAEIDWRPISLEDMPHAERRRIVLCVFADPLAPLERLESLLWRLARDLQERGLAHVVVVEAFDEKVEQSAGSGRLRLLYSPDGRGWSGEEKVIATLAGDETPAHELGLGEVHHALSTAEST
jgi:hypothetical protein